MNKLILCFLLSCLVRCLVPDRPDDNSPVPNPVSNVQQKITLALQQDKASPADCEKVYAIYVVLADYLESDQLAIENAQQLKQVLQSVIAQSDWPDQQYESFSQVLRDSLNEVLQEPGTILDRRAAIVKRFRDISEGGREAMR